ncbi:MAG: VOC family protein [Nitrospiria bacterium]
MDEAETVRPIPLRGLRHLALRVASLEKSRRFYEDFIGMKALWQPDAHSLYLTLGCDNLALHELKNGETHAQTGQKMDHFGLIAENEAIVDQMFSRVKKAGIPIVKPVKRHRDDSYSFYMADPDGNVIQILYEPHISTMKLQ